MKAAQFYADCEGHIDDPAMQLATRRNPGRYGVLFDIVTTRRSILLGLSDGGLCVLARAALDFHQPGGRLLLGLVPPLAMALISYWQVMKEV